MATKKDKMLMRKEAFLAAMNRLKAVYRNEWFLRDEDSLNEWYQELGEASPKLLNDAISYWISNNRNEPLPSDIIAALSMFGSDENSNGNPLNWPLWVLLDNSGKIIDQCFAPEIVGYNEMWNWFKKNHNDMFGRKVVQSSYEEVFHKRVFDHRPPMLPEGYSSWKEWCVNRLRGVK